MKAELITPNYYDDDFVVDCARISFDKRADQFTPEENSKLRRYLRSPPGGVPHWSPFAGVRIPFEISKSLVFNEDWFNFFVNANLAGFSWEKESFSRTDPSVIINGSLWAWLENSQYLPYEAMRQIRNLLLLVCPDSTRIYFGVSDTLEYDEKHTTEKVKLLDSSYFICPNTTYENIRITAPIFVARQLVKHQVHLCWSEVSRRYVKDVPDLFWPEKWHKAPKNAKQGASEEEYESARLTGMIQDTIDLVEQDYKFLIQDGLAAEEARMFLPLNHMTSWIWTGSIAAFARVRRERLAPTAQGATRDCVKLIDEQLANKYGSNWYNV